MAMRQPAGEESQWAVDCSVYAVKMKIVSERFSASAVLEKMLKHFKDDSVDANDLHTYYYVFLETKSFSLANWLVYYRSQTHALNCSKKQQGTNCL